MQRRRDCVPLCTEIVRERAATRRRGGVASGSGAVGARELQVDGERKVEFLVVGDTPAVGEVVLEDLHPPGNLIAYD